MVATAGGPGVIHGHGRQLCIDYIGYTTSVHQAAFTGFGRLNRFSSKDFGLASYKLLKFSCHLPSDEISTQPGPQERGRAAQNANAAATTTTGAIARHTAAPRAASTTTASPATLRPLPTGNRLESPRQRPQRSPGSRRRDHRRRSSPHIGASFQHQ